MLTYLITDDRYAVPTLRLHEGVDVEAAQAFALADLKASIHHEAVEVHDAQGMLFVLRRADLEG